MLAETSGFSPFVEESLNYFLIPAQISYHLQVSIVGQSIISIFLIEKTCLTAYEVTNPSTKLETMELILAWLKTVQHLPRFAVQVTESAVVRCCNQSFHLFFLFEMLCGNCSCIV